MHIVPRVGAETRAAAVAGLGISFFGFSIRRKISATGFTVMGCTNKLLTLLVNTVIWDKHASLPGQARVLPKTLCPNRATWFLTRAPEAVVAPQGCVLISIFGGVLYSELAKADSEANKVPPHNSNAPVAHTQAPLLGGY